jgi:hypothetical protein
MELPYIGITGFMSRREVEAVFRAMPVSDRLLMVGVLASLKATLRGEQNKWPNRYPKAQDIHKIFFRSSRLLNLIHYNTKEPETLVEQLDEMSTLGGPNLDGFQLNMAWPSVRALEQYKEDWGGELVLQVGGKAFEMVHHSPQELADKVSGYDHVVDYVLLDPSGGYGVPFDLEKAKAYIEALKTKNLSVKIGTAGGLSPTTLDPLRKLLATYPELSWDAEGRLRDKEDHLSLQVSIEYVMKSCGLRGAE